MYFIYIVLNLMRFRMRTFSRSCCQCQHNWVTHSSQQFNINIGSGSIFNCPSLPAFGSMGNFGNIWGMNIGCGFPQMMAMPFGYPMFAFMNFFNPIFNFMTSFIPNRSFADNNETEGNVKPWKKNNTINDETNIRKSIIIDDSSMSEVKKTTPSKKIKKPKDNTLQKVEDNNNIIHSEHDMPDEKIQKAVELVAQDAMKKYLKKGAITPQEILPTRADIYIKKVDIKPLFNVKSGAKNDYFNDDGDIIRVQDGTKLTITFDYKGQTYKLDNFSSKVSKKIKAKTFIERYSYAKQVITA